VITKHIVNNFLWLFADKVVKSFGNFLLNLQIILYLSIDDYGLLNLGVSVGLFVISFLQFYREIIVKEYSISKTPQNDFRIFLTTICLRLPVVFVVALTCFLSHINLIIQIIVISNLLNLSDLAEYYWQAKGRIQKVIIIRNIIFFIIAGLKLFLLKNKYPIEYFAGAFIVESVLNTIISFTILYFDVIIIKINFSVLCIYIREILINSLPLLLTGLLTVCYMRIDQILIKSTLGEGVLGRYVFALNIAEILQSFPFMFGLAIAPTLFQHNDRITLLNDLKKTMNYLLVLGLLFTVFLVIAFPFIANRYKVENVNVIFVLLAAGTFPTFFSYIATKYLIHTNQIKHFLVRSLYASIFSVIFNLVFINYLGLYAPAIGYFLSQWYIGFFSNKSIKDDGLFQTQLDALLSLFYPSTYVELLIFFKEKIKI
jgi:O-antigen/teichoic acid export membrane protein